MTQTQPATAVPALNNTVAAPLNPTNTRTDEFADYPRDQWDHPLIAVPGPDGRPVPNPITGQLDRYGTPILWVSEPHIRASTAGSALEHEGGINSWKIRQAVIGLIMRPDLFALAQSVEDPGADGRSELDKHIKSAQDAAGSGAAANRGTAMHAFAEREDRGLKVPPLGPEGEAWMAAYRTLTAGWRWEHIEARLVCTSLRMAGRTDRLGRPPGWMIAPDGQIVGPDDLVVVDLKTSSSSRYFGVKFAVQLAVYGFGDLYDPATGLFTATGARRDWALVLHIPSGASSGAWWWVNIAAGYELAGLANEVLNARKRKVVAMVATTYPSLEAALAAGGVLLDDNYAIAPGSEQTIIHDPLTPEAVAALHDVPVDMVKGPEPAAEPAPSACPNGCVPPDVMMIGCLEHGPRCEVHGPHPGTVACVGCLYPDADGMAGPTALEVATEHEAATSGARDALQSEVARLEAALEHERATAPAAPEPSDPTTWSATLGPDLQAAHEARRDPEAQRQREIMAVASAQPRGGLESVRQRYAQSWSPEHEAAAERRGWELGVLASLERAQDVDGLMAVHTQVSGWGAWSDEMDRVAARRAAEINRGDG